MTNEVRSYRKYEFCRAVNCNRLEHHPQYASEYRCLSSEGSCPMSAKEYHNWLQENGFFIVKHLQDSD